MLAQVFNAYVKEKGQRLKTNSIGNKIHKHESKLVYRMILQFSTSENKPKHLAYIELKHLFMITS